MKSPVYCMFQKTWIAGTRYHMTTLFNSTSKSPRGCDGHIASTVEFVKLLSSYTLLESKRSVREGIITQYEYEAMYWDNEKVM